jgi:glycosyltransferase involved in cell wall biosynthesis
MAMNVPVISTNAASVTELVDHGFNGLIVPEKDVKALSDAILELVHDKQKRKTMGQHGRKKIENEFNIETQVDTLLTVWRGILS